MFLIFLTERNPLYVYSSRYFKMLRKWHIKTRKMSKLGSIPYIKAILIIFLLKAVPIHERKFERISEREKTYVDREQTV